MKSIEHVVDFGELCRFASEEGILDYNRANDLLYKEAYPWPESPVREVYLSEMKYVKDEVAREILTRYMQANNVDYISVMK